MNLIPYLMVIATGIFSGSTFLGRHTVFLIIVAATASLSTAQTYAILFVSMKQYESAVIVAMLLVLSNLIGGGFQLVKHWNRESPKDAQ